MKIYIVVLNKMKIQMYIIKSDEYAMISTFAYFGNQSFLSSLLLHDDNIIVATLLECENSNIHKHRFQS